MFDPQKFMTNPLFLGGAALLSGEGMGSALQGMRVGQLSQQQAKEQEDAEKRRQQFLGLLNSPEIMGNKSINPAMLRVAQVAGPDAGLKMLADEMDPATILERRAKEQEASLFGLKRQKLQAEIANMGKEKTAEDPNAVREYRYYMSLPDDQKAEYLRVKRAERSLDLGPEIVIPNASNPAAPPVATFQKDLAGAERDKVVGRETGERFMGASKAKAALDAADAKSDIIEKTIADARKLVGPFTTGAGSVLSSIPGTPARDLSAKIDTLKANAGFAELQAMRDNSPTGGALGQVAVQELAMLQATITSLEQAQTAEQLNEALNSYEKFIRESKVRRKLAYDLTYGSDGGAAPAARTNADGWTEIDGVRIREKR